MKIHNPPMSFLNDEAAATWERNATDEKASAYLKGILAYVSTWATLMEDAINMQIATNDIDMSDPKEQAKFMQIHADLKSQQADDEGITGFMYGTAVSILAQVWKYGEALRKWHNKEYQIGTEGDAANDNGGVINPALLTIG